ncbi:DUF397 domain-containing protein [Streptomyces sp. NPDC127098]|uniref:DUF397 domain-containing protein n=1 Tax=Streptomyces sp. NPDC127098 TaxID=3347137 RepID=UPI0036477FE6
MSSVIEELVRWRKPSHSNANGDCVEVSERPLSEPNGPWRKSSRSNDNGDCVEVADGLPGILPVRDSKVPAGQVVTFSVPAWSAFLTGLKES